MSAGDIKIATPSGDFTGYLAKPASGKGPGIIVIQEIFGVNANIRAIADGYAAQGYFALAPISSGASNLMFSLRINLKPSGTRPSR